MLIYIKDAPPGSSVLTRGYVGKVLTITKPCKYSGRMLHYVGWKQGEKIPALASVMLGLDDGYTSAIEFYDDDLVDVIDVFFDRPTLKNIKTNLTSDHTCCKCNERNEYALHDASKGKFVCKGCRMWEEQFT